MQWAYVAGFFDGEGHVGLHPAPRGGKTILLSIANTHRPTIDALLAFFTSETISCGISQQQRAAPRRTCYRAQISGCVSVERAAQSMLPFSITKRAELELLLKYIREKDWLHHYTQDEVAKALAAYQRGSSLRDIEKTHRISSRSLRGHAKRLKVPMRAQSESIKMALAKRRHKSST